MAYSDFTLEAAGRLLGITSRPADLFPNSRPAIAPAWLLESLARGGQGIHLSLISEKSRSEFVVAPVLLAGRELSGDRFAIYSGQRLDVDSARGLVGDCDFILTASEPVFPLRNPIAVVVEAKKNDIEGGLGQCVAQMVAADQFNQNAGQSDSPVFGCVTTGEAWQFLKLAGTEALMDRRRHYIDNVDKILGVIQAIIAEVESGRPRPLAGS
jgi:hypothetical protein